MQCPKCEGHIDPFLLACPECGEPEIWKSMVAPVNKGKSASNLAAMKVPKTTRKRGKKGEPELTMPEMPEMADVASMDGFASGAAAAAAVEMMAGEAAATAAAITPPSMMVLSYLQLVADGNLVKVKGRLDADASMVSSTDEDGQSGLHYAAAKGRVKVIDLLIERGADIMARDLKGQTALHLAASQGQKASVLALLSKGAAIDAPDRDGATPLHQAVRAGQKDAVAALLAKGADIEAIDVINQTPLHWAALAGQQALVTLLLSKGAEINAMGNGATTPLHVAAASGRKAVVQVLLAKGAEVNSYNQAGETPLALATQNGHKDVIALLAKKGGVDTTGDMRVSGQEQLDDIAGGSISFSDDAHLYENDPTSIPEEVPFDASAFARMSAAPVMDAAMPTVAETAPVIAPETVVLEEQPVAAPVVDEPIVVAQPAPVTTVEPVQDTSQDALFASIDDAPTFVAATPVTAPVEAFSVPPFLAAEEDEPADRFIFSPDAAAQVAPSDEPAAPTGDELVFGATQEEPVIFEQQPQAPRNAVDIADPFGFFSVDMDDDEDANKGGKRTHDLGG